METRNRVKIGMAQLLVEGGEPERNFQRAQTLVEKAAAAGCHIALLPEVIDSAWTHPSSLHESQPIPGAYSDFFCGLAKKNRIYICVGLTEKTGNCNYNCALFINPDGEILLKYRKINLLTVEHPFYEVGQSLHVIDTEFGKLGINICADNYIDGLAIGHTLGRMGAQIILSPASWTVDYRITEEDDPYADKWIKPLSILAGLYDLVIVNCTSVGYIVGGPYEGKKMVGCSLAVGKSGIIAQGQMNEFAGQLVLAEFDIPHRPEKGTQIGEMLKRKGYRFDDEQFDRLDFEG